MIKLLLAFAWAGLLLFFLLLCATYSTLVYYRLVAIARIGKEGVAEFFKIVGGFTIKDFRVLSLMAGGDQVAAWPKRKQNAFGLRNFAGRKAL